MNPTFTIVDVFADAPFRGNQLAVFRHGTHLSTDAMQALARETHFSETTFLMSDAPDGRGGWPMRIFTPDREIPFAGHPTLGTAWVIQQELIGEPVDTITLALKAGHIPVTFTYSDGVPDLLDMTQLPPTFGARPDPALVTAAVSLSPDDLDDRFPIEEVSTGLPTLIIPLRNRASLERAHIHTEHYHRLEETIAARSLLLFAADPIDPANDLHVRVFVPDYGVPEDPATGSSNGCLAGWLSHHRYWGDSRIRATVEQGFQIHRPSRLLLNAEPNGDGIVVRVGGRVFASARGELAALP